MIEYDEGKWSIGFAFSLTGSVIDKSTCLALPCALLAISLNILMQRFPETANQLSGDMGENVHQGFSFVLGFLIVFRTQQAYSRWWEGGTLLQQLRGDWFNAFSNLMAFLNPSQDAEIAAKVEIFQHQMARLFSLLYGQGLEQVHTMKVPPKLQYINPEGFLQIVSALQSEHTHDSCELVLQWIQKLIVEANSDYVIKIAPPILARVYNQLGMGIVKLNNARKIKEFIVPFNLAQLVTVLLILHWVTTAVVCAIMLSNPWMAGLTAFLVCFSFWGVNYIAVELENPYGDDANDLPLCEMQEDMNKSLISLLRPHAISTPKFDFVAARDRIYDKPIVEDKIFRTGLSALQPSKGTSSSSSTSRFTKKPAVQAPAIDRCNEGNCYSGMGTYGQADDPSYRDSELANGASPAGMLRTSPSVSTLLGEDASHPTASTVGKQETEMPSPAGSDRCLLDKAQPGAPSGRGQSHRGARQRQPGYGGADPGSRGFQVCLPSSPSRGSTPDSRRPASLLGAAGSVCQGLGADRHAGPGRRSGDVVPGHEGGPASRSDGRAPMAGDAG